MISKKGHAYDVLLIFYAITVCFVLVLYFVYDFQKDYIDNAKDIGKHGITGMDAIVPLKMEAYVENQVIRTIYITARLTYGHEPMFYEDIKIDFYEPTTRNMYLYDNSSTSCDNMTIGSNATFRIEPVILSDKYRAGKINKDEMISICLSPMGEIGDFEKFTMIFLPDYGKQKVIQGAIPILDAEGLVKIYP